MEVFVVDEQHDFELDMERWQKLATEVLIAERVTGQSELTVIFADESTMSELNAQFMGKGGPPMYSHFRSMPLKRRAPQDLARFLSVQQRSRSMSMTIRFCSVMW